MRRFRALIVDDNPSMRALLELVVRQLGLGDVDYAGNGSEALNFCRSNRYDLILLDNIMPKMGGVDFVRAYRSDIPSGDAAAIIIVTASPDPDLLAAARSPELAIADLILKPFDVPGIKERIRRVLARTRRQEDPSSAGNDTPVDAAASGGRPLSSEVVSRDGVGIVILAGALTQRERATIARLMEAPAIKAAQVVALDLADIDAIDEYGIGSLLVINGLLTQSGKQVRLLVREGKILERLRATRVDRIIPFHRQWSELFGRASVSGQ